jgi:hypothetical protein
MNPVIYDASSDARNRIARDVSRRRPLRLVKHAPKVCPTLSLLILDPDIVPCSTGVDAALHLAWRRVLAVQERKEQRAIDSGIGAPCFKIAVLQDHSLFL